MSSDEAQTPATPANQSSDPWRPPEDRVPTAPTEEGVSLPGSEGAAPPEGRVPTALTLVDGVSLSDSKDGTIPQPEDAAAPVGKVALDKPSAGATSGPASAAPSVHDQQTVTSIPGAGADGPLASGTGALTPPPATDKPHPWADPGSFAAPVAPAAPAAPQPVTPASPSHTATPPVPNAFAPPGGTQPFAAQSPAPGNPFAPPTAETAYPAPAAYPPPALGGPFAPSATHGHSAGPGVSNPFAPPAPGATVPPPPISPDGPGQVPYGYPQYPGAHVHGGVGHLHAPAYGWPAMPPPPSNGMGIAAMVLGICAAALFCLWPLAILLGVLAVIFGVIGRAKARRGEATNPGHALAGIICGVAGFLLGIGFFVLILVAPDGTSDDSDTDPFGDGYDTSLSLVLPADEVFAPLG